jgi:hypothetical protein
MDLLKQQDLKYWWIRFTILKADGSSDSTRIVTSDITGTAGTVKI